ncbi:flagellar biosynthetic protein FliR [Pandoraea nosoerga]|uniref:Flagellar biosynthetic protein FliR n=1 Tax=Pandoraea nosoerga TaxID=2508296 RepID=A0A5E4WDS5_9BURK|nr:flagellar biosynthetic protein FliR [Pandoraea nosoerga]MBN4668159.1 flagellar biosynthetic protein FliR [Pandoraea nosoerga]MBN4678025.1 flagellar biosynthetic protein FliR [Pandoraea nosoerga]MBN4683228.1 flagellar biosynthetic protein FliR [Pandoraea nosoerga]MBN4747152.1 flagellar biosynthetic protein FliR [Pandoraea nosoerga]VVE22992.1 flagellar biosynthetic protein FliR [Pandoraea nosoerga]
MSIPLPFSSPLPIAAWPGLEGWLAQWPAQLALLWWPFCRFLAALSMLPLVGEGAVPVRWRILASLALSLALWPVLSRSGVPATDPFSLAGVALAAQQALIGAGLGLAFFVVRALLTLVGYLCASQMGLAMAAMNDPMNGEATEPVSLLMMCLGMLLFFIADGHLIALAVVARSFDVWPIGVGLPPDALGALLRSLGWTLAAAMTLALPVVLTTFIVQFGLGLLNRAAPALNLFSLGFAVTTLVGLVVLAAVVPALPAHYLSLTERVLDALGPVSRRH